MLRAARERQRAALRGMVDDRAALQRLMRFAQRAELLEVLHQFGILVSPRVGSAVERVFKALHAGLVAVVEHRRAGEGVEDQRRKFQQRHAARKVGIAELIDRALVARLRRGGGEA